MSMADENKSSETVEQGIIDLITSHERAWNAHDPEMLINLFDEPMDFVNVLGMHHRSKVSLRKEYEQIHATFMRNSTIRMHPNDARLLTPEIAVAHAHWEMAGVESVPGWKVPEVRRGVMTYVLVRRSEKWKIAAAHNADVVEVPGTK